MTDIPTKIREALREILGLRDSVDLSDGVVLQDGPGGPVKADSLDMVEIVMDFEDRFGIEIDDATAEGLGPNATVGDLISLVERAISEGA